MRHTLLVVPARHGAGLTSACLSLVRAFERQGVSVAFCKPIAQPSHGDRGPERSTALVRLISSLKPPEPLPLAYAIALLGSGDEQRLMEEAVARCDEVMEGADVVVLEGLVPTDEMTHSNRLNQALALSFDAEVILVDKAGARAPAEVAENLAVAARLFADGDCADGIASRIVGCILNQASGDEPHIAALLAALADRRLPVIGCFPFLARLTYPRTSDLARELGARVLNAGDPTRRIVRTTVCAQSVPGVLKALEPGSLLITPGDRHEVIMAVCLAALNGVSFAGLLLTVGIAPDPAVDALTQAARATGLPILLVDGNTYDTAARVHGMDQAVAIDDRERAEAVMAGLADHLDSGWVKRLAATARGHRLSPPAFRHRLIEAARQVRRRIVLPEGNEPRTVRAAVQCHERGIARCILLGRPDEIAQVALHQGLRLPADIEVIDPAQIAERYIAPLVELRRAKGMTEIRAREELADAIVVATMMLKAGEVDGLVSGAVHTTAHTVRPALQIIKTRPGTSLVSSIFFMCLPEQVVVYGDCAVNPDPNAGELADIALQSADSARAFGIEPRVAMISYSTGASGTGSDVDKVREATRIARERRPDLAIDGPLQYDAAAIASVARTKSPDSRVAGQATVFIFPDLNTGNTTYKAVQRSAGVVSIGPMLQGLAKPVNDLSRGALVEDIVYTIAITAIQAGAHGAAKVQTAS